MLSVFFEPPPVHWMVSQLNFPFNMVVRDSQVTKFPFEKKCWV
jgi:hypothetical protein